MNKQKVYIETTLFNYYFDTTKEAQPVTVAFFEAVAAGEFEAYTSAYTMDELEKAMEPKRSQMIALIEKYGIIILAAADEYTRLAQCYINAGAMPAKKRLDALHLACASVNRLDLILSYNFKHINKVKTKVMGPAINQLEGYASIIITRPEEVIDYEADD
ncbi:MAG: hypothetical protein Pg6C_17410 [Treponemataceae bacterium]|nr:MAG: hypothetical protein Pg6C_17410 [Treponemataceae bacterium]